MRDYRTQMLLALSFVVIIGLFQNCAQHDSDSAAADEPDHIVHKMTTTPEITSGPGDASTFQAQGGSCNPSGLTCLRIVYSPAAENQQYLEKLCMSFGDLCFEVSTTTYDTTNALSSCEDCGPEASRPGGRYNREEYSCWYGRPGSADTKAYAIRDNLDEAVQAALQACSSLGGAQ